MADIGMTVGLIKALAPKIDPDTITGEVDDWLDEHPEATTTVEDGSITKAKLDADLKAEIEKKADNDGLYEQMTVGNAEQLVATVGVEDKAPYNFRTAGGSADIGDRETDMIVGGTVAWNQLSKVSGILWSDYAGISFTKITDATIRVSGTATANANARIYSTPKIFPPNHIYLFDGFDNRIRVRIGNSVDKQTPCISKPTTNTEATVIGWIYKDTDFGDGVEMTPQVFDLTQMFGSTIADYIYSLETATAGAGVAWFRKLFPKDYYAYDAGSLQSVQAKSHVMRGFNQWDTTTDNVGKSIANDGTLSNNGTFATSDYIRVVSGAVYYFKDVAPSANANTIAEYDANKSFIRVQNISGSSGISISGTKTMSDSTCFIRVVRFTTSTNPCINLSWDGERDGEYEAYDEHVYPLDDSLTLRGIPKLDANNNLYYDGDTYENDGTVTRRYGVVDLGTLSYWSKDSNRPGVFYSSAQASLMKEYGGIVCDKYAWVNRGVPSADNLASADKTISLYPSYGNGYVFVVDVAKAETSAEDFKTAMSGVYLIYELATPTTETADTYQNPQIVDDFGTEEYIDAGVTASTPTRDVAIPVGHETTYQANLRAKLEMAPESPDGDGDYIVRQTNGQNEYVELVIPTELPTAPTTDGNYLLKCTVSSGTTTYTWEAQS